MTPHLIATQIDTGFDNAMLPWVYADGDLESRAGFDILATIGPVEPSDAPQFCRVYIEREHAWVDALLYYWSTGTKTQQIWPTVEMVVTTRGLVVLTTDYEAISHANKCMQERREFL